jgi:hypothetical protein
MSSVFVKHLRLTVLSVVSPEMLVLLTRSFESFQLYVPHTGCASYDNIIYSRMIIKCDLLTFGNELSLCF